jgi:hypothetical protein
LRPACLAALLLVVGGPLPATAEASGSIHGTYWHDVNANGQLDPGESGLPGREIMLEADDLIRTSVTGEDGGYRFLDLPPDDYSVRAFPEPGWPQTWPPCGFYTVELTESEATITNLNFGSWESNLPPAGHVPDGVTLPDASLQVEWTGEAVVLSWGYSCLPEDSDYEIYEGDVGLFYSHGSVACTTGGELSYRHTPASGNTYYLVVPSNGAYEGSYGLHAAGMERPTGDPACLPRRVGSCPWAMPAR